MSIKELNAQMRKTYHAAGYTGKNVVFAVLDTGVNPVGPLRYKVTGDADGQTTARLRHPSSTNTARMRKSGRTVATRQTR